MPIPKNIRYDNSNNYTKKTKCVRWFHSLSIVMKGNNIFSQLDTIDEVYRFVIQVESASNQDNRKTYDRPIKMCLYA